MDKSQESLQSRNGVLFFLAVNQLMLSVMSIVLSFPLERNGDPQRAQTRLGYRGAAFSFLTPEKIGDPCGNPYFASQR